MNSSLKIKDLGALEGPLLVFGGIYSNLEALNALIALADGAKIAPKNRIFTGDSVAYCADARAVLDRLIETDYPMIAGNCEKQLAQNSDDCGCGFTADSMCSLMARGWYNYARGEVTAKQRNWMAQLPDWLCFRHANKRYVVIHGGADDIARFIWSNADRGQIEHQIDLITAQIGAVDVVLCGHSGIYFKRLIANTTWLNCGAIGMPANNGQSRTQYVMIDAKGRCDLRWLRYDYAMTQDKMQSHGLIAGYETCLQNGYWPSQDSLPLALRH